MGPSLIHATPQSKKIKDRVGLFFSLSPSLPVSASSRRVLLGWHQGIWGNPSFLAFQWAREMNERSLQVARCPLCSCCFVLFFFNRNGGPNCCQIGQARAACHAASGLLAFMVVSSSSLALRPVAYRHVLFSKTVLSIIIVGKKVQFNYWQCRIDSQVLFSLLDSYRCRGIRK